MPNDNTPTSYDWVAGAGEAPATSTYKHYVFIENQGYQDSVLTLRIGYDDGVVDIAKYHLPEANYSDFERLLSDAYYSAVIDYLEDYGTLVETIREENIKKGTDLEVYLQRTYSAEAVLSDDELDARQREFLENKNLRINNENDLVQDIVLDDLEQAAAVTAAGPDATPEQLSLEFRVDLETCSKFVEQVRGNLSKLVSGFKQFNRNRETVAELGFKSFSVKQVETTLKTVDYGKLVDLNLFCVPGQKVTYLALATTLLDCFAYIDEQYRVGFKPFKTWVGCLVNSNQLLQSASASNSGVKVIDNTNKAALASCFNGTNVTVAKYSQLVSRNADWGDLYKTVEKLTDLGLKIPPKALRKETEELYSSLELLANAIDKSNGTACSKTVTALLAEYCFQFSAFLEFYSVTMNLAHQLAVALDDSVNKISAIRG